MAKLRSDPITESDLVEYVDKNSDFAFELFVLNRLLAKHFECEHGGTYDDRLTGKIRQYDIRAQQKFGYARVLLAIECKQLRNNHPLLVMRVPRRNEESFHELLLVVDPDRCPIGPIPEVQAPAFESNAVSILVGGAQCLYPPAEPVGKSCAQVGKDISGIVGTDSDMFVRWTQAIASAHDLVDRACSETPADQEGWICSLVLPIVVVPDRMLWGVDYGADGRQTCAPMQLNRCTYFVHTKCDVGGPLNGTIHSLSHMEFVTTAGLDELIDSLHRNGAPCESYFPRDKISKHFRR